MPTVAVDSLRLCNLLGDKLGLSEYNEEALAHRLEEVCFRFGLEVDGVEKTDGVSKMRIEIPANRYDLLCLEGISDALLTFLADPPLPFQQYKHVKPDDSDPSTPYTSIKVTKGLKTIRPYCLGAIFRNVTFDQESFASFIDLQDKLHQNIGRRRTLLAIGTHNLDAVQAPFTYEALPQRGGFKFVPLNQTEEVDGEGMFELLKNSYLKSYLNIISQHENIPVIKDAKGRILSVPPIINADFCKMSHETKNVFVEVTAVDLNKAKIALDTITAFMAHKIPQSRTVEPIRIKYEEPIMDNNEVLSEMLVPALDTTSFKLSMKYCRRVIGLDDLRRETVMEVLPKMALLPTIDESNDDLVHVQCPISRRDILHPCDIVEDVAIAIGYNNIASRTFHAVNLQSIQNLSERVRRTASVCGWRECLTFGLISLRDAYADLRRDQPTDAVPDKYYSLVSSPAIVSAPKTKDFECVRPTLIPGLLKTLVSNQASELPIKLFEVGDCVSLSKKADNQTSQRRQFAAVVADHNRSGLEDVHGLLDVVMRELQLAAAYSTALDENKIRYELNEIDDGAFFKGRCVSIDVFASKKDEVTGKSAERTRLGVMGVIHPEVLCTFGIPFPCSLFEISLEPFLEWLDATAKAAP